MKRKSFQPLWLVGPETAASSSTSGDEHGEDGEEEFASEEVKLGMELRAAEGTLSGAHLLSVAICPVPPESCRLFIRPGARKRIGFAPPNCAGGRGEDCVLLGESLAALRSMLSDALDALCVPAFAANARLSWEAELLRTSRPLEGMALSFCDPGVCPRLALRCANRDCHPSMLLKSTRAS